MIFSYVWSVVCWALYQTLYQQYLIDLNCVISVSRDSGHIITCIRNRTWNLKKDITASLNKTLNLIARFLVLLPGVQNLLNGGGGYYIVSKVSQVSKSYPIYNNTCQGGLFCWVNHVIGDQVLGELCHWWPHVLGDCGTWQPQVTGDHMFW